MQGLLRRRKERGAVERRTEPGRGRAAELHRTPLGQTLLAAGRAAIEEQDQAVRAVLGAERADGLTAALLALFVDARDLGTGPQGAPEPT